MKFIHICVLIFTKIDIFVNNLQNQVPHLYPKFKKIKLRIRISNP